MAMPQDIEHALDVLQSAQRPLLLIGQGMASSHAEDEVRAFVERTQIPFDVNGCEILLVDDVLYSGRTVRAAMNELFDYGRPQSISLVVLADRGGRQLPICAQHCGARVDVPAGMRLTLKKDDSGKLALALEPSRAA